MSFKINRTYRFSDIDEYVYRNNLEFIDDDPDELNLFETTLPVVDEDRDVHMNFLLVGYTNQSIWRCIFNKFEQIQEVFA
jgi:hypothetical protein